MTSGDLTFDLTKSDRSYFFLIFDALSNAAYPVSLRGPGAELEGGCSNTPPPALRGNPGAPAGRGLKIKITKRPVSFIFWHIPPPKMSQSKPLLAIVLVLPSRVECNLLLFVKKKSSLSTTQKINVRSNAVKLWLRFIPHQT